MASSTDEDDVSLPGDEETDTDNSGRSSTAATRRSALPTTRETSYLREGVCGLRGVAIAPSPALLSREKGGLETFLLFENCPASARHESRRIERNRRGLKLLQKKLKMLEKQSAKVGLSSNIKSGEGQSCGTDENKPGGLSDGTVGDPYLLERPRGGDSVGDKELTGGVGLNLSFSEAAIQGRSSEHLRTSRKRGRAVSAISGTSDETSGDDSRGETTVRWPESLEGRVSGDRRNAVVKKKRIQGEEKRTTATSRSK